MLFNASMSLGRVTGPLLAARRSPSTMTLADTNPSTAVYESSTPPSLASFWNSTRNAWLEQRGFGNTWVTITPRAFSPSDLTKDFDELFDSVLNWVTEPAARAPAIRSLACAPVAMTSTA